MWAQLIKMRAKPGKDMVELSKQLQAVEQPDSGLVRTIIMGDQKDPEQLYVLAVLESDHNLAVDTHGRWRSWRRRARDGEFRASHLPE